MSRRIAEIEDLLSKLPKAFTSHSQLMEQAIVIVNGELRNWPTAMPDKARMKTFDEMVEDTLGWVKELTDIPGARFRSFQYYVNEKDDSDTRLTSIRLRVFIPRGCIVRQH